MRMGEGGGGGNGGRDDVLSLRWVGGDGGGLALI